MAIPLSLRQHHGQALTTGSTVSFTIGFNGYNFRIPYGPGIIYTIKISVAKKETPDHAK
ncbi:hypothetical protein [Desulfosporosinus sp. SB140]|uniref:hypothetical protein n=1 Tax=Desulfosporosinus paludis TaxID=3115649 RepID=UPI00388FA50F